MAHLHIDDVPTAPPALLLMLQEFAPGRDWQEVRRRIRAGLRDMKDQSLAFESQNLARPDPPSPFRFEIHPHGALDLLSGHGCIDLSCRIAAAERLARSLGLIADRIWLTDHLSTEVLTLGRATNESIDRLMHHAVALAPLLPLMKAGIVRFRSPWIATCSTCAANFDREVKAATNAVMRSFSRQVKVERKDSGGYFIRTGTLFEPTVMLHSIANTTDLPSSRQYGEYLVAREVRQILWAAREAAFTGGTVFTNSRAASAGMLQCDGRLPKNRSELRVFEDSRAFDMPWVSELNPTQVLQLREEASDAIPLLREMLGRAARYTEGQPAAVNASDLIATLRAQAAEVRADLSAKRAKSARYWKITYGVLGLGISVYGFATDQVLPGVGGLQPILQLLIGHKTGHESEVAKIKNRPGYVLVKAQDILAHAR